MRGSPACRRRCAGSGSGVARAPAGPATVVSSSPASPLQSPEDRAMDRLECIVAATDLSSSARHACDRAAQLAASHGASLALMHTVGATALDDLRRWIGEDPQAQEA